MVAVQKQVIGGRDCQRIQTTGTNFMHGATTLTSGQTIGLQPSLKEVPDETTTGLGSAVSSSQNGRKGRVRLDNLFTLQNEFSSKVRPHKANDSGWEAILKVKLRHGELLLNHFKLLRRLGCGDIGSVYLAELEGTDHRFAMKVMDLGDLASRRKQLRAETEREILSILDHPFLPTLYADFETPQFLCLVMEFCPGGDLHTLRQNQIGKCFSSKNARFYAAEVLMALEYLHMMGVVYRDLKPENVLVRGDGHVMLSDFDLSLRCTVCPTLIRSIKPMPVPVISPRVTSSRSQALESSHYDKDSPTSKPISCMPLRKSHKFENSQHESKVSKQVSSKWKPRLSKTSSKDTRCSFDRAQNLFLPQLIAEPTGVRSMSFVGTHEYLAPEIISGDGHGNAVDWWTFGVFMYELLYGKTPFKGDDNDVTLVNVVSQQLEFPLRGDAHFREVDPAAKELIKALLVKDPQKRLGSKKGAAEVKQHSFFEGINWALIRCALPPQIPRSTDNPPMKTSYTPVGKKANSNATTNAKGQLGSSVGQGGITRTGDNGGEMFDYF